MERIVFDMPEHPAKGPQKIVVEKEKGGVWMLVVDEEKAKPLPTLDRKPKTAKEVLDALSEVSGDDAVAQFVTQGFSLVE